MTSQLCAYTTHDICCFTNDCGPQRSGRRGGGEGGRWRQRLVFKVSCKARSILVLGIISFSVEFIWRRIDLKRLKNQPPGAWGTGLSGAWRIVHTVKLSAVGKQSLKLCVRLSSEFQVYLLPRSPFCFSFRCEVDFWPDLHFGRSVENSRYDCGPRELRGTRGGQLCLVMLYNLAST